jgi:hypothetical protein
MAEPSTGSSGTGGYPSMLHMALPIAEFVGLLRLSICTVPTGRLRPTLLYSVLCTLSGHSHQYHHRVPRTSDPPLLDPLHGEIYMIYRLSVGEEGMRSSTFLPNDHLS